MATRRESRESQALQVIRRQGIVRAADLEEHGIPRGRLYRLVRKGLVERQARGIYAISKHRVTAEHTLAQVAKQVPGGVFSLLTALRFHELTTQAPAEVWIALPEKARKPRLAHPRLRVTRFSGPALSEGIETHRVEGVEVRIYSAAKTVADCFRFRSKVGMDVALESLREGLRARKFTRDDLWAAAQACRVTAVVRPYLEAL